ncbi:MAG: carboxypeptidase regulatory-like domain-containing protein [Candidatus Jettenia sp.]|nr:MAG: carboxypeptidase regulatory-like domain-containing protein [Candidatus Jettenia sp.]
MFTRQYKKQYLFLICFFAIFFYLPNSIAQENEFNLTMQDMGNTKELLNMRFFDSAKGYAIQPDEVTIVNNFQKQKVSVGKNGRAGLSPEHGTYDLLVKSKGYHVIQTKVTARDEPLRIEIFLDPVEPPQEMKPEFVKSLLSQNTAVIIGYVIDEDSGQPLPDVVVRSLDGDVIDLTNERGFFELLIPYSPSYKTQSEEFTSTMDIIFEKVGYSTVVRANVALIPNDAIIYKIRLLPGGDKKIVDEKRQKHCNVPYLDSELEGLPKDNVEHYQKSYADTEELLLEIQHEAIQETIFPTQIRVGRGCPKYDDCRPCSSGCIPCPTTWVGSIEQYCKYVLPNEWSFPTLHEARWKDAFKAGAVAVRSYGIYFVNNTTVYKSHGFDICDTDCCQVFDPSKETYFVSNAVNETANQVLVIKNTSNVPKFEYSAQQNNAGCGNCYTGTCIYDPVCCDEPNNGHGRGMCQVGSMRWASGLKAGVPHSYGTKNWQEILKHYYPNYDLASSSSANLTPYQPSGWSDKIVVSKTTGTNIDDSPLYTTDTLYIDWAVINNGISAITNTIYFKLYVDGTERISFSISSLNANVYAYATDYSLGTLNEGTHYIKIIADATGAVQESNESDNEYTKTITVQYQSASFGSTVTNANTGSAISGASVKWGSHSTTTDGSGKYIFNSVPCQTNTLEVSKSGYQPSSQDYTPPCNQCSVKDVPLTPSPTPNLKLPLSGNKSWLLTVEAGGKDFWGGTDIYHTGNGYYSLDFDDYTKEDGKLTDVSILAAGDGQVIEAGWSSGGFGYTVFIDHDEPYDGNGYATRYGHLKETPLVSAGQKIK